MKSSISDIGDIKFNIYSMLTDALAISETQPPPTVSKGGVSFEFFLK
jgi:hypothetical protein